MKEVTGTTEVDTEWPCFLGTNGGRSVGYDPVRTVASYLSVPSCQYLLGGMLSVGCFFYRRTEHGSFIARMPTSAGTSSKSCGLRTATNKTHSLYYWPVVMRFVLEMCGGGRILSRLVTMPRCTDFRIWVVRSH